MFFFFIGKCPFSVARRIVKKKSSVIFFVEWYFREEEIPFGKKWDRVRKSVAKGGLGIRSIRDVDKALLGKWLWRLGMSSSG